MRSMPKKPIARIWVGREDGSVFLRECNGYTSAKNMFNTVGKGTGGVKWHAEMRGYLLTRAQWEQFQTCAVGYQLEILDWADFELAGWQTQTQRYTQYVGGPNLVSRRTVTQREGGLLPGLSRPKNA